MSMGRSRTRVGKLLDQWVPPDDAGEPLGCVATSYTFDSVFFEEECLTRFAKVESDPEEDGPAYLIEREERLAGISCAAVLVDQHHCRGSRSLRWDLVPVRVPSGIMHAKVSLLVWSRLVRLIVASANLTPDGYRRNQEVFGTLEHEPRPGEVPGWLARCLQFLEAIAGLSVASGPEDPAAERLRSFLTMVASIGTRAGVAEAEREPEQGPPIEPVFLDAGSESVLDQLDGLWHGSGPVRAASVTSPFFDEVPDSPGSENEPARRLWGMLCKRGEAAITWYASGQRLEDGSGVLLNAPVASLIAAQPKGRPGVTTTFMLAREQGFERDGAIDAFRPLHMKSIVLSDDEHALVMMGSSNFTTPGLGIGRHSRNIEANLAYLVSRRRHEREWNALDGMLPEAEEVPAAEVHGASLADPDRENGSREPGLPAFFGSAVLDIGAGAGFIIRLRFVTGEREPHRWEAQIEDGTPVCSSGSLKALGRPAEVEIPAPVKVPPSALSVTWGDDRETVRSWWPIVVAAPSTLPPPDELRDLPLQVLLEVIASARPAHVVLAQWLSRRRSSASTGGSKLVVDPLERVDSSGFILQRTRRVSWTLGALRQRLERPCATREQLAWRLTGPVGVEALAAAIERESPSPEERAFLLAELALELSRVRPCSSSGCLQAREVRSGIEKALERLEARSADPTAAVDRNLAEYVRLAFREARHER